MKVYQLPKKLQKKTRKYPIPQYEQRLRDISQTTLRNAYAQNKSVVLPLNVYKATAPGDTGANGDHTIIVKKYRNTPIIIDVNSGGPGGTKFRAYTAGIQKIKDTLPGAMFFEEIDSAGHNQIKTHACKIGDKDGYCSTYAQLVDEYTHANP